MSANVEAAHAAILGIVRNLEVTLQNERIVLRGQCRSFHAKKLAQDRVRARLANMAIINQVEVPECAKAVLTQ
jgi:hypothetical protein